MEGLIPDDHAIRFATTFYRQLAEGLSGLPSIWQGCKSAT